MGMPLEDAAVEEGLVVVVAVGPELVCVQALSSKAKVANKAEVRAVGFFIAGEQIYFFGEILHITQFQDVFFAFNWQHYSAETAKVIKVVRRYPSNFILCWRL